uniref:CMP/dCMP-type deaminase domain-containing protein n=1 Tax=Ditylenchus dipsaci TaxID=166011 RepID=A0A915D267_9BILA
MFWPTAFHEDKVLEKKLNGCLLDAEQCRLYTDLFFRVEQCSGALIYDPVANCVVIEETPGDRTRPLHHPVMRLVKALADKQSNDSHSSDQYLATGYDAFLACEPCTMCAMALVHCRVKRVFFGKLNQKLGALFSRWKLQESKYINHHYQVAQVKIDRLSSFRPNPSFRVRSFSRDKLRNLQSHSHTSAQIFDVANAVESQLSRFSNCLIGIAINKSSLYVSVVIGISQSGNAFLSLSSSFNDTPETGDDTFNMCKRFKVACVISEQIVPGENSHTFKCSEKINLFVTVFNKLPIRLFSENSELVDHRILYAIQTSGSTGQPKIVHVPSSAIMPNIVDFADRFELASTDTVLFSTQLVFDPSIVEMFLAMYLGCELLIPMPSSDEPQSVLIEQIVTHFDISFVQLTPAHLQRFSKSTLQNLFGSRSRVKCLLVGGDNFPTNLINLYRHQSHSIRIFNVYGVTEVSCWASCHELKDFPCPEAMPIGEPLTGTRLEVTDSGLVAIHGRRCSVEFIMASTDCTITEDISSVVIDKLGKKQLYVKGRNKPNSILPSYEIENLISAQYPQVIFAKLVYQNICSFLFLNSSDPNFCVDNSKLMKNIPKHLRPTRVFWNENLDSFITVNGKIDEKKLIAHAREHLSGQCSVNVANFLQKSYHIELNEDNLNFSLRNFGLGSLEFAELAFLMEGNCYKDIKMSSTELLQLLMDEKTILKDLVDMLENTLICENKLEVSSSTPSGSVFTIPIDIVTSDVSDIQLVWSSNLGKCIDGSPVIDSGQVYANSHAGIFRCFDYASGEILLDYEAQSCALEATCGISPDFVALGGLNGDLLVFERKTRLLREVLKTAGEIRMTPVFESDGTLFCGSYDGYLYVRNFGNGTNNRFDISATQNRGAMRSSPLVTTNTVVIATLGGHIVAIEKTLGETFWCNKVDGPVFANVVQISGTDLCCVVTVQGHINMFCLKDGKKQSELQLAATVFDAPVPFQQSHLLISGGNGLIFLLEYTSHLVLLKSFQLAEARIVRSPIVLGEFVFVITVQGVLYKIIASNMLKSCSNLSCTSIVDIKEETFGSPVILQKSEKQFHIIIGSRRDLLRCFFVDLK